MAESQNDTHQLDVLLVEDSPIQVKIVRHAIGGLPIFNLIHVADDGDQAMAYLRRQGEHRQATLPDVILCDINMPRKNGFEVLDEVRSDDQLRAIPFVMLTTSDAEADIVRAYKEGANTFISKPIDLHGLETVLTHFAHYWSASKHALDIKAGRLDPKTDFVLNAGCRQVDKTLQPNSVRMLLVEDSPTQLAIIRRIVSEVAQFHVLDEFADGEQAMRYLRRQEPYAQCERPDVIMLDLNMPRMSGFEVLRAVKTDPTLCDIIVVILTDRDRPEDIVQCYNDGANTFLTKPVTGDGIRSVLHRFADYWGNESTKLPIFQR